MNDQTKEDFLACLKLLEAETTTINYYLNHIKNYPEERQAASIMLLLGKVNPKVLGLIHNWLVDVLAGMEPNDGTPS